MSTPSSDPPNDGTAFLPPRWTELHPLLDQLLDAPSEERAARVVALSGGNEILQRQLEQLLAESERDMPLLDQAVAHCFDELVKDGPAAALPEVLAGRYRVGRELGHGGMATVYLARDEKHGRDVAVKVIRQDLSASLGHERFLREIEIAARLRHPNIVPLYDSGEVGGSLFFVMPYEEGQSLRERLRVGGALPIADAFNVMRDVARALAYAHEHGVVHRDIKPDNVMLSGGTAVVTDFGIAKALSAALTGSGDATLTQAGTVIGTPSYMAPEQATGDAAADHRADIYSFGCLAYELFAGHPPFQEKASHLLIAAHLATVPRPITELRADVPQPVADLLARCLAKDSADRPQHARDLLPILDAGATAAPASTTPHRSAKPRSLTGSWRWAAVTVFAFVVSIIVYFATRTAGGTDPITVAVLPFGNIAGDTAIDFVSDGLTDEVASALARVPGILIKSRTGARRYRGQLTPDVTEAGARLKADYLLIAVIRREQGRLILSADFEHAADATGLWDGRFDVSPNEQPAIADSIARSLSAALRQRFPRAIGVMPARAPNQQTSNLEAYRLYMLGQSRLARRTVNVRGAAEAFQQAIQQDSLFAPAYSGLSMALALFPWFQRTPSPQVHDAVVAAARSAIRLDSTLSLPHVAIGLALWLAYDWSRAETEFKTAIRLDPRSAEAHLQYGRLLRNSGRYREALTQMKEARRLDPSSVVVLSQLSFDYRLNGQVDSALVESGRALETDSASPLAIVSAIHAYLAKNRIQEARALSARIPEAMWGRAYLLAKSGDTEGARQSLRKLDARPPAWGDESDRAWAYLGLGDTANALSALERATAATELWPLISEESNPAMDPIRASPRYRALLKTVGLADYPVARAR
ncbi:MAG TPA: protein kinase [Gemmatimonadaceae bacterium]|nr:protein kinase [Gemmatimonadaceae bacterium]